MTFRLFTAAMLISLVAFSSVSIAGEETEELRKQIRLLEARLEALEHKEEEKHVAQKPAPVQAGSKLSQRVAVLERSAELAKEDAQAKAEKTPTVEIGKKGVAITSADKEFAFKLRGYAQVDERFFFSDDAGTGRNDFLGRRLRPIFEMTVYKDLSLRLMPDFAGSSTRVFDAHMDYRYSDALQFRIGKFKPPIGLERLQSSADIFFMERGHPANLAPSRDYGIQLYGEVIPQTLEYQFGVFNGNADVANTDGDDDDRKDYVARIFAHPFRNAGTLALQGLGVGLGGSIGEREGAATRTILGDYRTPGQQAFFRYRTGTATTDNTYADGTHKRLQPQAYYYYDNMGLLGEYAISSQEVTRATFHDTLIHQAWQVAGSYVLTGENATFKGGIKPAKNFDPRSGGLGAFELVARIGQTDIDNDTFPNFATITSSASKAEGYGVGINWYWNESFKLWLNYDVTSFDRGAAGTADRPDEHALFSRAQYRF